MRGHYVKNVLQKLNAAALAVALTGAVMHASPGMSATDITPTIDLTGCTPTTDCAGSTRTDLGSTPPNTARVSLSYDYSSSLPGGCPLSYEGPEIDYFLIEPVDTDHDKDPGPPKAVLVLFEGGDGVLGIRDGSLGLRSSGFLLRRRWSFAGAGPYVVALVDRARVWLRCTGDDTLFGRRLFDKHMEDIANVIADLRNRYPDLPVWAVGMSRGTISAAASSSNRLASEAKPDGLVLFSPVTKPSNAFLDRNWVWDGDGGDSVRADTIDVPTIIISHADDACGVSLPTGPRGNDALVALIASGGNADVEAENPLKGGYTAISNPCDALSPHGFFGKEGNAIAKMKNFIRDHTP